MTSRAGVWPWVCAWIALPTLLPLGASLASFTRVDVQLWSHMADYVLPQVLPTTLLLLAVVSLGVATLGTTLAVLVSLFEFPARRFFAWALLLPLAMPAYVLATVFVGALDYAGSIAVALRHVGLELPELRNTTGACLVLIAALYPYVYLVARASLASQAGRVMEAARSLGLRPRAAVRRVALPLALPAILGGTLLAAMETLADFGAVSALNVDTLSSAIYKAWFALFSVDAALQLAGILLLLVLVLVVLQQRVQATRRVALQGPPPPRLRLQGRSAAFATGLCALVFGLAFLAPAVQLAAWAAQHLGEIDTRLFASARNSAVLGVFAAGIVATVAVLIAYAARRAPVPVVRLGARIATLGYALPGPLLAVGLFVPLAAAIRTLNEAFGWSLLLQGGLALMLLAYTVRFTAVAHAPVSAGLARIRPSLDEVARLSGVTGLSQLLRVHLPLLRPGLAAGCALVFVDVMKEMPITLMTRPFGWDTLAVRIFEMTSEGQWERAALPSLAIVVAGLLPVILLIRSLDNGTGTRGPAA